MRPNRAKLIVCRAGDCVAGLLEIGQENKEHPARAATWSYGKYGKYGGTVRSTPRVYSSTARLSSQAAPDSRAIAAGTQQLHCLVYLGE